MNFVIYINTVDVNYLDMIDEDGKGLCIIQTGDYHIINYSDVTQLDDKYNITNKINLI